MDKTQFIWRALHNSWRRSISKLADVSVQVSDKVIWFGLVSDSILTFVDNAKKWTRSCFYQSWQLHTVHHALSVDAAEILILMHGLNQPCGLLQQHTLRHVTSAVHLQPFQSVLNASGHYNWQTKVQLGCFHRGVDVFTFRFYLDSVVPINHSWHQRLETLGYPLVKTASLCVPSFLHSTKVWRTDRRTDLP